MAASQPVRVVEHADAAAPDTTGAAEAFSPADLRRFEEQAFPRPGSRRVPPPALEGDPAPDRQPRPSAIDPPDALRSAPHQRPAVEPSDRPSWLSRLSLPDLPVVWDEKVIRYLEYYRDHPRGRALMQYWLRRQGRHAEMISRVLRKHELPQALLYLAMIESSYDPTLTSRAGAAGLWQFMPHSGRAYGLQRDHWVDERRNPARATEAAARHLRDLRQRFGSWELALAAYNAGSGMIIAAMQKYNTNDYWRLCRYEAGLPWETTLYVPKILAAAIVGSNREQFGFGDVEPLPAFDTLCDLVALQRSATVGEIARAAGSTPDEIARLNPELRRGRTPPQAKVWVRVPAGTASQFYTRMSAMRRVDHRPYVVRLGDTEEALATSMGVSRNALRQINGITHAGELRPGLTILVPASARFDEAWDRQSAACGADDPLIVVALPEDSPTSSPGRSRVFYRTVVNDSLPEVASHLGVAADELARWNGLAVQARLVSGMVLQAFVAPAFDRRTVRLVDSSCVRVMVAGSEEFLDQHEERNGRRRVVYQVREGDTLTSVGRRFGLSEGSLARINRFSRSTRLTAGQRVVVYVKRGVQAGRQRAGPARPSARGARAAAHRLHEVRPGDTLTHIARRYGVGLDQLKQRNRLDGDKLVVGQRIVIPRGAAQRGR